MLGVWECVRRGFCMFWAMNQSERSITKRKKLSRFRVYKPVGNPVVPELFQEKKFPLELDPVPGLILAEANIAHLLTSSYRWPLWLQTKIPKMNTSQTPLLLVITSLGQLQVLSWFLFWFEVQFPGTWILHIGKRRMRPPTTFKLQMDLDPTCGTSLLLKPNLKPEYGNNSIFYPCSIQICALIWIYKELQFWVLISFQTQRTAGSGSLEEKKSQNQRTASPGYFKPP